MRINIRQLLRSIILAGFTAFFIKLHYTGEIANYVNPKYDIISQIALGIFAFLSVIQLFRVWEVTYKNHTSCSDCGHHHHESSSLMKRFIGYAIIITPLLTGFMLSPTTLDSSIAAKKGTILPRASQSENTNVGASNKIDSIVGKKPSSNIDNPQLEHKTPVTNNNYFSEKEYDQAMEGLYKSEVIHMKETIYAAYYDEITANPKGFIGKKIIAKGFVYKEDGLESNQLVLSRFYMVHCVADASIVGFLSEFDEASTFQEDTWLEIEGTLNVTTYNGFEMPVIKVEKWTILEGPSAPYIYPPLIKVA
ncbi:TIGR03943 family protein [Lederbergia sp. NSJ-179]|uniref:TIGR03943 family putative permease subunit n=1 Tax=Lederbergia sp. NSJ-179 TaxID=2931402 RepID=UPI001FD4DA16|nr:TIGR03943 family protein [Lederbergia sp. NSJ-179]MCJ7840956.1 TIGR03943 family protein [Lederbergia sp. NSJ-179]